MTKLTNSDLQEVVSELVSKLGVSRQQAQAAFNRMTRMIAKMRPGPTHPKAVALAAFVLLKGADKHPEQTKDAIIRDSSVGASFMHTLMPIYNMIVTEFGIRTASKEETLASRTESDWHHP